MAQGKKTRKSKARQSVTPPGRQPKKSRWRKLTLACLLPIVAGTVVYLLGNQLDRVKGLGPPATAGTSSPTVQATASPPSAHVTPPPTEGPTPTSQTSPEPIGNQLTVPSEAPVDPGGNMVWMFPSRLDLSAAQKDYIDYLEKMGQYNSIYDYLYQLGGYLAAADTSFTMKNNTSYPIWIDGIYPAGEVCQAPLTGTLVDFPDAAVDQTDPQLGINLDSPSEGAELAPGPDMTRWRPGYFSNPVFIAPHKTYVFAIRAETMNQACIFYYEVTFFSNGRTFTHRLGNQQFRVSAFSPNYIPGEYGISNGAPPGYQAIYVGGWASPKRKGPLMQVYPGM
jgi:hypothetical protein